MPSLDAESLYLDFDAPCVSARPRPHEVKLAPDSRLVADSADLDWSDAFALITSRRAWAGRIEPTEHLGIVYCLRGVNRVERRIEGEPAETVAFRARHLALLPSHAPAWFRVEGDADVLSVYLRGGMLRAVADRLFGASTKPLLFQPAMSFSDPLLEQMCLAFAAALYRRNGGEARYISQLAEAAAAHCLVHYAAAEARARDDAPEAADLQTADLQTALQRVCAYVDEHLDGDLSLEALAREARLSPAVLKRAFASVCGATPRQWIIQRRVAEAERLLAGTNLPLAEIAFRTGFASQSHLTSMFKRETGRTPNGYRRAR